ncbi:MAG TPA: glutamine synthetase family protein [Actinomycetota bacterium]|nr:glutamine synthetase family protein [Actinomycetota bacterium]
MEGAHDHVLRIVEDRAVRVVQLWFTDVLGISRSFDITPGELERALAEGITFDGSAIDGFSRVQESDVLAKPDPKTFQLVAWRPDSEPPVARVACDILNLDGTLFEGSPRNVLRRTLERARELGFSFYAAPEVEYFYLTSGDTGPALEPLDHGSYFELTVADKAANLRKATVLTLEDMGIPVEYSQHEDAPGQHEIDLRHADALSMADTVMTVRHVAKELAQERGAHATFMPKPFAAVQGSGMHTHFSLFEGNRNAFHDPGDPHNLSAVARGFIAGLLAHAREITAVTNQWVNSYKRLVAGYEAPVFVAWARNNRSVVVNVPHVKKGRPDSTRIEYRAPDSVCNPYLAFAVILAAGLKGVEHSYKLPAELPVNLYQLTPEELLTEGIVALPGSLGEAIYEAERSELVAATLGEHVFEWFIRNKKEEWRDYIAQVTQWEVAKYLPML